jgi:integrase
MASIYEKNGHWYLRYKAANGRWSDKKSAARTKKEARRLADDLERSSERERFGLEQAATDMSVGDLVRWWLENVWMGRPSYAKAKSACERHLISARLFLVPADQINAGQIERFLDEKTRILGTKGKPLGPQAVNHLRSFLRRAFAAAIKEKMIAGPNPLDEVRTWKVPKRKPDFLRLHEVGLVLPAIPSKWRPLFATAVYAGLRKGELLGLRKQDVDFDLGLIFVRRSYGREIPKGGHEDGIPVAAELYPYLQDAVSRSASSLVFPKADGTMYPPTTQLEAVLRRALRRAGIVQGYRHKCRKQGCGHVEASADGELRRCPKDGHKLWVTSLVRPIRFHDLRHTTGSLLTMRGANLHSVQRILRHSDPRTTAGTYLHLEPGYLRREIDLLSFAPTDSSPAESVPDTRTTSPGAAPFAAILLLGPGEGGTEGPSQHPIQRELSAAYDGAGYRVRTDDIQLGKTKTAVPGRYGQR